MRYRSVRYLCIDQTVGFLGLLVFLRWDKAAVASTGRGTCRLVPVRGAIMGRGITGFPSGRGWMHIRACYSCCWLWFWSKLVSFVGGQKRENSMRRRENFHTNLVCISTSLCTSSFNWFLIVFVFWFLWSFNWLISFLCSRTLSTRPCTKSSWNLILLSVGFKHPYDISPFLTCPNCIIDSATEIKSRLRRHPKN